MKQATTLEEYAIERIHTLEAQNQSQDTTIKTLQAENERLQSAIAKIAHRVSVGDACDGHKYLDFDNVWSNYDPDDFKFFVQLLGIEGLVNKKDGEESE